MLKSFHEIKKHSIHAIDGEIGKIVDFYFDDQEWMLRYVVVETGIWFASRRVLLSPAAFTNEDFLEKGFQTSLTRDKVKNSPVEDSEKPVSRQLEEKLNLYYCWQPYWLFHKDNEHNLLKGSALGASDDDSETEMKSHLKSFEEIKKYRLEAHDGSIGQVEDGLLDSNDWRIHYLIVDTGAWLGRKVLVAADWIQNIHWKDAKINIFLRKEDIKNSPRYDSSKMLDRTEEEALYAFYRRHHSWK